VLSKFRKFDMTEIKPKISVKYSGNATIITFTDAKILEEKDIRLLRQSMMGVVDQAGRINLVLDFCNVQYFSSAVLGLLIRLSKKVYESGGQLRLCNISPKIYEIFKITRLTKVFEIYPDADRAMESLKLQN